MFLIDYLILPLRLHRSHQKSILPVPVSILSRSSLSLAVHPYSSRSRSCPAHHSCQCPFHHTFLYRRLATQRAGTTKPFRLKPHFGKFLGRLPLSLDWLGLLGVKPLDFVYIIVLQISKLFVAAFRELTKVVGRSRSRLDTRRGSIKINKFITRCAIIQ